MALNDWNESAERTMRETQADGPGIETFVRERRRAIGWIILVAYSLLLVGWTWYPRAGSGTASIGLWGMQDPHRLAGWIGGLVLGAFWDSACFLPVGFIATVVIPRGSGRLSRLPLHLPALATVGILAAVAGAIDTAGAWPSGYTAGLVFPLLGGLLGIWAGATWPRGWRARLWFLPKVALLFAVAALGVGILAWLSLEPLPLAFEAVSATAAEKRQLVDLIRSKEPSSLKEGQTHTLRLTEQDLNVLLAWGLALGTPDRKAQVSLTRDSASLSVSARMPLGEGPSCYLNLVVAGDAAIENGSLHMQVDRCRVGSVEVPRWVLGVIVPILKARLCHDPRAKPFLDATRHMVVGSGFVELTYGPVNLPPELRQDLFGPVIVNEQMLASTQAQLDHLVAAIGRLPPTPVSFDFCFETVFALARDRSTQRDPVQENQAGIFALGMLLGHLRVGTLLGPVRVGDKNTNARRAWYLAALRGRYDWTRHFCVSAVIAILSDETVSGAAGLLKEILDADTGGSGFSFADLLADRAGTLFALRATHDEAAARAMQDRLADGFRVEEFFPPAADLPEGISDVQLRSDYGGVEGEAYRRLIEEIERRLAACAAYQ